MANPQHRIVRRPRAAVARQLGRLHRGWWVLAIEAVAGAEILQRWVDIPIWVSSLALMVLLTLTDLASVKAYGEFEFWFACPRPAPREREPRFARSEEPVRSLDGR